MGKRSIEVFLCYIIPWGTSISLRTLPRHRRRRQRPRPRTLRPSHQRRPRRMAGQRESPPTCACKSGMSQDANGSHAHRLWLFILWIMLGLL